MDPAIAGILVSHRSNVLFQSSRRRIGFHHGNSCIEALSTDRDHSATRLRGLATFRTVDWKQRLRFSTSPSGIQTDLLVSPVGGASAVAGGKLSLSQSAQTQGHGRQPTHPKGRHVREGEHARPWRQRREQEFCLRPPVGVKTCHQWRFADETCCWHHVRIKSFPPYISIAWIHAARLLTPNRGPVASRQAGGVVRSEKRQKSPPNGARMHDDRRRHNCESTKMMRAECMHAVRIDPIDMRELVVVVVPGVVEMIRTHLVPRRKPSVDDSDSRPPLSEGHTLCRRASFVLPQPSRQGNVNRQQQGQHASVAGRRFTTPREFTRPTIRS